MKYTFSVRRRIEVEADSEEEAMDLANNVLLDCRGFADFDYDVKESDTDEAGA